MTKRSGFSILEITVASMLLGTLATLCVQYCHAMAVRRAIVERQKSAIQEASNLLEILAARPWEELTPHVADTQQLSERVMRTVPDARLEIEIGLPMGRPPAKRIAVEIHWPADQHAPAKPVRLVTWRYKVP